MHRVSISRTGWECPVYRRVISVDEKGPAPLYVKTSAGPCNLHMVEIDGVVDASYQLDGDIMQLANHAVPDEGDNLFARNEYRVPQ